MSMVDVAVRFIVPRRCQANGCTYRVAVSGLVSSPTRKSIKFGVTRRWPDLGVARHLLARGQPPLGKEARVSFCEPRQAFYHEDVVISSLARAGFGVRGAHRRYVLERQDRGNFAKRLRDMGSCPSRVVVIHQFSSRGSVSGIFTPLVPTDNRIRRAHRKVLVGASLK